MILEAEFKALIKKYRLTNSELYRINDKLMLISKGGIRKIVAHERMRLFKNVSFSHTGDIVAVVCRVETGDMFGKEHHTYEAIGEASPQNSTFKYRVSVAEARAESRAVLGFLDLYSRGIVGEMEIDEFQEGEALIEKRKSASKSATEQLLGKLNKL